MLGKSRVDQLYRYLKLLLILLFPALLLGHGNDAVHARQVQVCIRITATGQYAAMHTGFVKTRVRSTWNTAPDPSLTFEQDKDYVFRIFHPAKNNSQYDSKRFRFYKKSILNKRLGLSPAVYRYLPGLQEIHPTCLQGFHARLRSGYLLRIKAALHGYHELTDPVMNT